MVVKIKPKNKVTDNIQCNNCIIYRNFSNKIRIVFNIKKALV